MNVEMEADTSMRPECEGGVVRVVIDNFDMTAGEMSRLWAEQDKYIDLLESRLREGEEKVRGETSRREQMLVMRLTGKEQELQEMTAQIAELKASQAPSSAQLRQTLLDPAVNLVIQRLTKECDQQKKAAEEAQNELAAWKFTPDSATGKRLMAKCRQLYQENEDLGKMIASGRLAKLEGELALQKNLTEEMKKNQHEMDEFMAELDEDVEGMQSTIYYLQQQLREAKDTISKLEAQTPSSVDAEQTDNTEEHREDHSGDKEKSEGASKLTLVHETLSSHSKEEEEGEEDMDGEKSEEEERSENSPAGLRSRGRGKIEGEVSTKKSLKGDSLALDDEKDTGPSRRGKRKRVVASRQGSKRTRKHESDSDEN